ncbi:MAG: hypothetical protein AAGJ29_14180, partial [Pseudomonadota bacterium]
GSQDRRWVFRQLMHVDDMGDRPKLMRYLDYCTEMLSLTGKLAALYMQDIRDAVVIQAVNEIEDLTSGLSNKIWQKLQILHNVVDLNEADRQPVGGTVMPMPKAGHPSN